MIRNDHPAEKFDRNLLEEATFRTLAHYTLILNLNPEKLCSSKSFEEWVIASGSSIETTEEGGAVAKRPNGSFVFIDAGQLQAILSEFQVILTEL